MAETQQLIDAKEHGFNLHFLISNETKLLFILVVFGGVLCELFIYINFCSLFLFIFAVLGMEPRTLPMGYVTKVSTLSLSYTSRISKVFSLLIWLSSLNFLCTRSLSVWDVSGVFFLSVLYQLTLSMDPWLTRSL
jgi:hypothetical protein